MENFQRFQVERFFLDTKGFIIGYLVEYTTDVVNYTRLSENLSLTHLYVDSPYHP